MTVSGTTLRAGVVGWPVGHSLSPALHGYWISEHGLDATYEPFAVRPEAFASTLPALALQGVCGVNITLPHKEAAFQLVDERDEAAEATGAVNTVVFASGRMLGRNTDVFGFVESLREVGVNGVQSAAVLGAGGAARAIVFGLLSLGVQRVSVVNRTLEKANALRAFFGDKVIARDWPGLGAELPSCDMLVNTTSLGMSGQPELMVDLTALDRRAVVADIVYRPLETRLLAQARARGHTTIDGLGMLMHQARLGFAAWFGVEPQVTPTLKAHLVSILEGRG